MLPLIGLHLLTGVVAPALVRLIGRRAFWILAAAPASAAVWALVRSGSIAAGEIPTEVTSWVPGLGLELAFRVDTLSWLMVVLVGGVGALVLGYSSAYLGKGSQGLGRFGGVLVAFAGSMLGLVTTDDLLLLYVFWELTTVTSYVLIGHYADRKASRRAAMQAIIVTTAGGLALLVGVVLLAHAAGTTRISEIVANPPAGTGVTVAVVLLLVGAITKSALVPFHFWLPAAMAAPTPVSAYLHAAAMVKAGVYLVARFAPAFAELTAWQAVVLPLGVATLLVGGYRALRQYDLKLVLAFGTVSQLGLLVLLVGYGTQAAALAGLALLGAHAMFKSALFLGVGVVDAATGTRDLRRLSGLWRQLPVTALGLALATASMIGLPPFAGYVAKEAALDALAHDATAGGTVVRLAVITGSVLTVAYGLRFWWGAFGVRRVLPGEPSTRTAGAAVPADEPVVGVERPPSLVLVGPAVALGTLGLVTAVGLRVGEHLLSPHAALHPGDAGHLTFWSGWATGLTTLAILAGGVALFVTRAQVERLQAQVRAPLDADLVYRRFMRRLDDVAADVTAVTQRGSLPLYLGVALLVMIALVGGALLTGGELPAATVRLWDEPAQGVAAAIAVVSAVLAARSRRRLKAVLLTGVSGFAVATLFWMHGAPDLALTQVLVETITLVVFVLVLRRLPAYFSVRPLAASRWLRLAIGIAAGVVVGGLAILMPAARTAVPVSVDFPEEAYVWGGGKNIVNVTLVDIRAWDTMGEIAVLLVAATGVASLIFAGRGGGRGRGGQGERAGDAAPRTVWRVELDTMAPLRQAARARSTAAVADGGRQRAHDEWLRGGATLHPYRRSVIFEIATRLLFHTMLLFAAFLLFSGHNAPGGGFAAGLVVGIALAVRYLAGGRFELGEAVPLHPGLLLGSGLFLSAGVGLVALLTGGSVLESVILEWDAPVLGPIKLVTSLFFDVGVFLVVVGLVLDLLRSLGAEVDRHAEESPDEAEGVALTTSPAPTPAGGHGSGGQHGGPTAEAEVVP